MKDLYPLLFPATFVLFLVIERLVPTRPQPPVRGWLVKSLVLFGVAGAINATLPRLLGAAIAGHSLLDLSALGTAGGAVVALLGFYFVQYWMHRTIHRVTWLWRCAHQLHHSAERVDIAGFAYAHPLQIVLVTSLGPITMLVLGVTPGAAMVAGYVTFVLGLVEHFAVATPRWLGYIISRPESHSLHHERGIHAYNYGLPLFDMLFGTYRNPTTFSVQNGFYDGASQRTWAMLLGRDVARR